MSGEYIDCSTAEPMRYLPGVVGRSEWRNSNSPCGSQSTKKLKSESRGSSYADSLSQRQPDVSVVSSKPAPRGSLTCTYSNWLLVRMYRRTSISSPTRTLSPDANSCKWSPSAWCTLLKYLRSMPTRFESCCSCSFVDEKIHVADANAIPGPSLPTSTLPRAGVTSRPLTVHISGVRRSSVGLTVTISSCLSHTTWNFCGCDSDPSFCIRSRIE